MLYMVIEKYKDKEAVYRRFHEKGRMMPTGVTYVNSRVAEDGNTCYQINEAESLEVLQEWASNWNDVTDFTFIPVISSHEIDNSGLEEQYGTKSRKTGFRNTGKFSSTNVGQPFGQ